MKKSKWVFLLPVFLLAGWNPKKTVYECQEKIKQNSENLGEVKKKIEDKNSQRQEYMLMEKAIKKEIEDLNGKFRSVSKSIKNLDERITASSKEEEAVQEEIAAASLRIDDLKAYLDEHVREYYLESCISSDRYEPLSLPALCRLAEIDHKIELVKINVCEKYERNKQKEKLLSLKKDLEIMKNGRKEEKIELVKLEAERKKLKKEVSEHRAAVEEDLEKLKSSAAVLEALMKKLEEEKDKAQNVLWEQSLAKKKISQLKGKLVWPVEGKIISSYGKQHHPEVDAYVFNNGIRIESRPSQRVNVIARGNVVFADEFAGYGKMVVVDHQGGYYSVYANLGRILVKEKQAVEAFDEIGCLDSDSNNGILYFEFRTEGKAVNPLVWLRK